MLIGQERYFLMKNIQLILEEILREKFLKGLKKKTKELMILNSAHILLYN